MAINSAKPTQAPAQIYVSAEDLARRWSISPRAAARIMRRDLDAVVLGLRCVRVRLEDVERYENRNKNYALR